VAASDPLDPIMHKIAACVRMLLASEGERNAAMGGLQRIMRSLGEANKNDVHAIADRIEGSANGNLPDSVKEKLRLAIEDARAQGYAEGVRAAESKHHGTGAFRNSDGTLDWKEVALFVQREKHRLNFRTHEFIDKMAANTVWDREPTQNQHKYLHSLFHQLGGKIT